MSTALANQLLLFAQEATPLIPATATAAQVNAGAPGSADLLRTLGARLNAAAATDPGLTALLNSGVRFSNNSELLTALAPGAAGREVLAGHIARLAALPGNQVGAEMRTLAGHATLGAALQAAWTGAGAGAGAATRVFNNRAALLDSTATGYLRTGSMGGTPVAAITGSSINEAVFAEYDALRVEAQTAFNPRGVAFTPPVGAPTTSSSLSEVGESIRRQVEQHERDMGIFEGTLPKAEMDRIIKENLRGLKSQAGEVSTNLSNAVRAHKQAASTLSREYSQWASDLRTAQSTVVDSIRADAALSAAQREAAIREVGTRVNNLNQAMSQVHTRQINIHERALEDMKGIVETLAENGVKLKHEFNFDLGNKEVRVKTASEGAKAGEKAGEAGSHVPPGAKGEGGSLLTGTIAGAVGGVVIRRALFSSPDEENGLVKDGVAAVAGGFVGRTIQSMMGNKSQVAEFPELMKTAVSHGVHV